MNIADLGQSGAARIGNLYGWAIGFAAPDGDKAKGLLLTSNDYYAKIDATLPDGLSGGRVAIVIDALTDADYAEVKGYGAASLYLFWQDANPGFLGYLAGISGLSALGGGPSGDNLKDALVMRFAFEARRRVGKTSYETVLEGRDLAFHKLSRASAPAACFDTLASALAAIAKAADVTITPQPTAATMLGQTLQPEDEKSDAANPRLSCAGALGTIVQRIAAGSRGQPEIKALASFAPAPVLLRDGEVHVGRRAMPFPASSKAKPLDGANGLVEATRDGAVEDKAAADKKDIGSILSDPPGDRWTLLCRGRPDIKPGDIVQFKLPDEDVSATLPSIGGAIVGALAGGLAGPLLGMAPEAPDCALLVTGVSHALSRTEGFSTKVSGRAVPMTMPSDPWSLFHTKSGLEEPTEKAIGAGGGDRATQVGRMVSDMARAVVGRLRLPEVGEVRSAVTKAGSPPEPPAQTVTVYQGTGGRAANANQSRRLPIKRTDPYEQRGIGVATPFAWGACGLAVPRYPGMRVVLNYMNGVGQDPIDIGATWGPDQRMDSEPGDWWLKLPVGQSVAGITDTADHLPSGKVVNDLTDKDGVRVIEVGKLTIRVGNPPDMAARPKHKANTPISIEHSDGKASITMDQDGKITITGKTITIDAGSDGTVAITAKDVNVSVGNQMSVGG